MWKYAVRLSYDGTQYCGWQRQSASAAEGGPSIQATIEAVLREMTSEPDAKIVGSGRTDSGVHALGQVAHFVLQRKEWDPMILRKGLNGLLPAAIRALKVVPVPLDFHAQRSAQSKQYSYYFQQGPAALPHQCRFSWWIQKTLDLDAMNEGLAHLLGEHDFKPFQASGAPPRPTVRRILEAQVTREPLSFPGLGLPAGRDDPEFNLVRVRVVGTGFLKQMVRGIAGTLLQVGEKRRPASDLAEILRTQDRNLVGPTAPGRGLWLERVWYPGDPI